MFSGVPLDMTYAAKPVQVNAMQLPEGSSLATQQQNQQIAEWVAGIAYDDPDQDVDDFPDFGSNYVTVETPFGEATADPGSWVVEGDDGTYYVLSNVTFAALYEEA